MNKTLALIAALGLVATPVLAAEPAATTETAAPTEASPAAGAKQDEKAGEKTVKKEGTEATEEKK